MKQQEVLHLLAKDKRFEERFFDQVQQTIRYFASKPEDLKKFFKRDTKASFDKKGKSFFKQLIRNQIITESSSNDSKESGKKGEDNNPFNQL